MEVSFKCVCYTEMPGDKNSFLPQCLAYEHLSITIRNMDGWVEGWMDGWMDGRTDGWTGR